tara:strand:- start:3992 stop:4105 length:114 start_codon:yes stop_codon:yes gene_type:complete
MAKEEAFSTEVTTTPDELARRFCKLAEFRRSAVIRYI